jgi:hypothetical protein
MTAKYIAHSKYLTSHDGPATTIPRTTEFCTILRVLTSYGFLGREAPAPCEDMRMYQLLFKVDIPDSCDSIQTLCCHLLEGLLLMADERHFRHRPVLGGWQRPNRCTRADLKQFVYSERELRQMSSGEIYSALEEDIRQMYRLGRAAQLDYQKQRHAPWKKRHVALAWCLVRVVQLGLHLCEIAERWFAEVCLRRLFRDVWGEMFGHRVAYPDALKPLIEPVKLTLEQRNAIVEALRKERKAGKDVAPPFAEVLAAYDAGEWPQDLKAQASEEEWAARVPTRWL